MPIYEYECKSCGHRLEAIQGFDEAPLTKCPTCKKAKLAKLLSAPAFHLKGNGWYATDFKNPAASKKDSAPESESSSSAGSGGADECKTETKATDKKTSSG